MLRSGRRRRTGKGPLLSAALIVRDEEHHLADCLDSIEPIVDEVVVVDTGSVDGTVALAEDHGARVHHKPWQDDFALARNYALEQCTGRWILYIDADERVRPVSRRRLESELTRPGLVGAEVMFHAKPNLTAYPELRLFLNDPRIRFEGLIHETIWPGVLGVIQLDGGGVGRSSLVFDHVGYEGSQEHKYERDLPMLERALELSPDHVFCWFHLGHTHMGLRHRAEARAAWRSGLEAAGRTVARRPADSLPAIALASDLLDTGESPDAVLDEALELFPHDPMLAWLSARSLMAEGRWDEAIGMFEELTGAYKRGRLPDSVSFDTRHFTSRTDALVGDCHHQAGRYGEAAAAFRSAAAVEPDNVEYKVKLELNEHLADAGR